MVITRWGGAALTSGLLFAAGCGGSGSAATTSQGPPAAVTPPLMAVTELVAKSGSAVTGGGSFEQTGNDPVRVHVRVAHATPGPHGLHVHEKGDCSDAEAKAAGGHFNPAGAPHGGPQTEVRHAGDLGNIEVRADGTGDLVMTTTLFTVNGGPTSLVGRSLVFHSAPDDLVTQPTGNSGARQACGVLVASPR